MKHLHILMIIAAFALSGTGVANINLGAELGFGLANNTDSTGTGNYGSRFGLNGALVTDFAMGETFLLSTGLGYFQKGFKNSAGTTTVKLDYLEIPVLAKWRFMPEGQFHPTVFVGPFLAFALSRNSVPDGGTATDVSATYGSTDWGLTVGGGFEYGFSETMALAFNLRYDWGIPNQLAGATVVDSERTRSLITMVGLMFTM